MPKYPTLFLLFTITLFSCHNKVKVEKVERAFYYWKDNSIGQDNVKQINKLKVKKIYYKFFEIDYSEARGNFPYSKNRPSEYEFRDLDSTKIIPTIFIRNGIFQYNDEKSLDKLADNLIYLTDKYKISDFEEIQIDCDWTKSTKEKYFYLLKKIKALSKKQISCTLRLYPYKYPDIMGVPPVDKTILMCYNLIKPLTEHNQNSILDLAELKKYLNESRSYPLHMDIALPTFYWTQLYQNNRFVQLIDLSPNQVKGFAKAIRPLWYQVQRDTSINYRTYLRAGDMLKCEDVPLPTIKEAITLIKKNVELEKNITLILFDLDQSTFTQYKDEEITDIYNSFTK